jgi:hypothetical protein
LGQTFKQKGEEGKMHSRLWIFLIFSLLFIFNLSQASVYKIDIKEVIIIQNEFNGFRVLLNFEFPEELQDVEIDHAEIVFPITNVNMEFTMEIYSVTTPWQSGTTWNVPWDNPGGDFNNSYYNHFTFDPARISHEYFLNVTTHLCQIQNGSTVRRRKTSDQGS